MLRRIAFSNVIQFVEHNVLNFAPSDPPLLEVDGKRYPQCNLGIFVGENGSGKSSIFELIVSCAALPNTVMIDQGDKSDTRARSSTVIPNTPSNGKSGYIFCEFDIPPKLSEQMKLPLESWKTPNGNHVVILGLQVTGHVREKVRFVVIPVQKSDDETCLITEEGVQVTMLHHEKIDDLFLKELASMDMLSLRRSQNDTNALVENISTLYQLIQDSIIVGHRYSQEDFDLYIKKAKEDPDFIHRVHEVFYKIIGNTDYSFIIEDGELFCQEQNNAACENKTKTWQAPSGILDAFLMAFYLSLDDKLTLLLEEPIKSMHPILVRALRDIFLLGVSGKTVIAVCHSERLISAYTVAFMYRFRRERFQSNGRVIRASTIYELKNLAVTNSGGHPFAYLTVERIRDVLFANRILFVEGRDDRRFVHATLDLIERKHDGLLAMCGEDISSLIGPLTQISVIQMDGKMHMDSCIYVAENSGLRKRYSLLLDRDVLTGNEVFVSKFVQTFRSLVEVYNHLGSPKISQIICEHCLLKYDSSNQDRKHFFGIIREILKAASDYNFDSLRGVVEKKLMPKFSHIFHSSDTHSTHVCRPSNCVMTSQHVAKLVKALNQLRMKVLTILDMEKPRLGDLLAIMLENVEAPTAESEDPKINPSWDDCLKLANRLNPNKDKGEVDISYIMYRIASRNDHLPKIFTTAPGVSKLQKILHRLINEANNQNIHFNKKELFLDGLIQLEVLCGHCIMLEETLETISVFESLFACYCAVFASSNNGNKDNYLESKNTVVMQFIANAYKLCFRKSATLNDLEAEVMIMKKQTEERRFIWIDGDLEDMVNTTKQDKLQLPLIKRNWSSLRRGELWALVKELVEHNNKDFKRFVQYLVSFVKEEFI